jgi:hypothetical protein
VKYVETGLNFSLQRDRVPDHNRAGLIGPASSGPWDNWYFYYQNSKDFGIMVGDGDQDGRTR